VCGLRDRADFSQPKRLSIEHELGTDLGLINLKRPDSRYMSRLTRHFGRLRADDHEIRMTSLAILVMCVFE